MKTPRARFLFLQLLVNLFTHCGYRARFKRLNESTVQLDGIEQFLSELHKSLLPRLERVEGESLLASLPLPEKRKKNEKVAVQQLSIIPPDPEELSPSILTTALPSLLPINTTETAKSTSFAHPFGPTTPTPRHTGSQQTTNTLHEELSSELERMAQQLKRNAMHFSTSLVKDKAVIEDTEQKIERNTEVLARQRVKMRSNTCLVVGIVVLVAVVFAMIVIVIRFS